MSEEAAGRSNFIGFEYRDVLVKKTMQSVYLDNYRDFGWIPEGDSVPVGKPDFVTLRFKRDRKIRNKAELTRLQRQFETYVTEIVSLEALKTRRAASIAFAVGIIGTAFITGSVFAVTADNVAVCVSLAIPGFLGWITPYILYRNLRKKKTEKLNPLISEKYEELYFVCERANALLD
jgi:uncharacterized protein YcgL (UPF0745 family)